ncbi:hypothetical protein [Sphingobacterium sp. CZ-UAM]|uniref:hypothetical protein n=1 Tax=Sphingobacterium sp. CZ-UAM TaxID=1933868 RepID=UPI001C37E594|nr:hypothetical protein [Sphingobacterium sp. CZ-UAM]
MNVLTLKQPLKGSVNNYDWLGNGMYFWENSQSRALEYAQHLKENPGKSKKPIKNPFVIGSVIHLGNCLDLLDYEKLSLLKFGYEILEATLKSQNKPIPKNKPLGNLQELMLRDLDCAVIETLHKARIDGNLTPFDSVRGVFWEGEELYPNAGFREKDHIQICIRNPNCIKGFFLPRDINTKFTLV